MSVVTYFFDIRRYLIFGLLCNIFCYLSIHVLLSYKIMSAL
jgi:hypothetical protein